MTNYANAAALWAVVTLFIFSSAVQAQNSAPRYEWGLNLGLLVYQGDLTPHRLGSWETKKLSLAVYRNRLISSRFAMKSQLLLGRLEGNDAVYSQPAYRQQRNFYFRSPLVEASLQWQWSPLGGNFGERRMVPYVFAGAGISWLKLRRDWSRGNAAYFAGATSFWEGLDADGKRKTPSVIPVLPLGGGAKYFVSRNWAVTLDLSYRLTGTDMLDGFSRAANPDRKDNYINYAAGIIYHPSGPDGLKCFKMKY